MEDRFFANLTRIPNAKIGIIVGEKSWCKYDAKVCRLKEFYEDDVEIKEGFGFVSLLNKTTNTHLTICFPELLYRCARSQFIFVSEGLDNSIKERAFGNLVPYYLIDNKKG